MTNPASRVTIHMAASLDGFIARRDGRVDWMETADVFDNGETMSPEYVESFLKTIGCYVMGARTYETALAFEEKGFGWAYGDTPTFVLSRRDLPRRRPTINFVLATLRKSLTNNFGQNSAPYGLPVEVQFVVNASAWALLTKCAIQSCRS